MLYTEISVPPSFFAAKWIPIVISIVAAGAVSWLYVLYYRHRETARLGVVNLCVTLCLGVMILTAALTPVDIYTVGSLKTADGQFEPWALNGSTVDALLHRTSISYYVLYTIVFLMAYVALPFAYFYSRNSASRMEDDEEPVSVRRRLCVSLGYAVGSSLLLITVGSCCLLLPAWHESLSASSHLPHFDDPHQSGIWRDLVSILLYFTASIGSLTMISNTGFGLSLLPMLLFVGIETPEERLHSLRAQRATLQTVICSVRDQVNYSTFPSWHSSQLERLQREDEQLQEEEIQVVSSLRSCCYRMLALTRPLQILLGVLVSTIGCLFFFSLLLTNIDKAVYSDGRSTGFALTSRRLPNPLDWLLVELSRLYPLDLLLYVALVVVLVVATLAAVHHMGLGFCCRRLYDVARGSVSSTALILLSQSLVFVLVALQVFLLAVAPHYTMFGSQHYRVRSIVASNAPLLIQLLPCTCDAPPDQCVLSRLSSLLLSFTYRAVDFGTIFYYCTWLFLISVVAGFIGTVLIVRWSRIRAAELADAALGSPSIPQ